MPPKLHAERGRRGKASLTPQKKDITRMTARGEIFIRPWTLPGPKRRKKPSW